MKTEVNLIFVSWTRKRLPLDLNGVMENILVYIKNILVCVQFSSKLANVT